MTNEPLISVIMPVKNAAGFLVEAIESIRSQTYKNWELICINDHSTDGSEILLREYAKVDSRIKVYTNTSNKGIGFSLNRGIKVSNGEFIARMDADDVSLPNRFEKQFRLLNHNPNLVACGGQAAMIDATGEIFAYKYFPTDSKVLYDMIMKMVPIQHPILMARASVFKKYRYIEKLTTAEDVDMFFYLLSKGNLGNVGTIVYKYRKSDTSNGYHNVKKTFTITVATRFKAIISYGYRPTASGVFTTLLQYPIVVFLPSKLVVRIFEAFRLQPPFWKRPFLFLTTFPNVNPSRLFAKA